MTDASASADPSTPAKGARGKKSGKAKEPAKPASLQAQIQAVVWWVADMLRDKTSLQVEAYQPVTLALMALKRNLDIQAEELRATGRIAKELAAELPMLQAGIRDPKDVARKINATLGFWDPSLLDGDRFGLPLMTYADLVNFEDAATSGPREEPYVMVLRANPPGCQTPETALFTYSTRAPDLKALILEIIDSLVPDLREAFGAIGIHGVLSAYSEHAATLKNEILREICTTPGSGSSPRLVDFDMGLSAISTDIFSDTYMDLLGRFAEASGKRGGEYFTPTPLVNNAIKFLPIDEIATALHNDPSRVLRVGDPTAGSNTFLVKFHEAITQASERLGFKAPQANQFAFYAQELKNTQVGLGVFNMFYHGLASRLNPTEEEIYLGRRPEQGGVISRITGNTISEYTTKIGKQAGKLDVVVANPPYGTDDYGIAHALAARTDPLDRRWIAGVPTRSEGEWGFGQTINDLLTASGPFGVSAVVLPMGVLFRDGGGDFRKFLVEKDYIEGIIATPSNQFLTTSIPVCIIIFNKNKKRSKDGIYFINASEDFTKVGKFNHWNEEKALEAWRTRAEIPGYSGFIPLEKLRKVPKYSLAVNRFFSPIKEKEQVDPRKLSEEVSSLRSSIAARGAWLDNVFEQATSAWQPPAPEGNDVEGNSHE